MKEYCLYYCKICGHCSDASSQNSKICPRCQSPLSDLTDLPHTPPRFLNEQEVIRQLLKTISDLEQENKQLSNTVSWMHDTIWEQLRLIRIYRQDSKIPVGKS